MLPIYRHKNVPKFSKFKLKIAELSAISIWNGINYETGKEIFISDEELLKTFSVSFLRLVKRKSKKSLITESLIRSLIKVAKMKAMYRSSNPTDFKRGIRFLRNNTTTLYENYIKDKSPILPIDYAINLVLELGKNFPKKNNKISINGNYRIPLATRVLFFAIPDMPFFNFSERLAKKMNFQSRPQAAIPFYMKKLERGLYRNKALFKMKLPPTNQMDHNLYNKIKKTNWWQRRILDLALLFHFKIFKPHKKLIQNAAKIVWAKKRTVKLK
jgi:hypothetical protein